MRSLRPSLPRLALAAAANPIGRLVSRWLLGGRLAGRRKRAPRGQGDSIWTPGDAGGPEPRRWAKSVCLCGPLALSGGS